MGTTIATIRDFEYADFKANRMYFTESSRYLWAILSIPTASLCLANDTLPSLQRVDVPQPVRRVHYVDSVHANPPIPIPVRTVTTQPELAPRVEQPQKIRIDTGTNSPTAWTLDQAISATLTSDPILRIGKAEMSQAQRDEMNCNEMMDDNANFSHCLCTTSTQCLLVIYSPERDENLDGSRTLPLHPTLRC